ncbi:hypothetical protein U1Q18_024658 [Sarracenia purpurea var. burkii]
MATGLNRVLFRAGREPGFGANSRNNMRFVNGVDGDEESLRRQRRGLEAVARAPIGFANQNFKWRRRLVAVENWGLGGLFLRSSSSTPED